MTGSLPAGQVTVSLGTPQNLAKSENTKTSIREFADWFKEPLVTKEKFSAYVNASFKKKQQLKASAGWIMRCPVTGGIRNRHSIQPSDIISFDMDDVSPQLMKAILAGKVLKGAAMVVHTTRSHTPESPRLRVFLFPKNKVKPDDYNRISRIVGLEIDPKKQHIDPVSFRPAQMMFLPSVSINMLKHYKFYVQPGELLDTDLIVEDWEGTYGDSQDISNLPRWPNEAKLREVADQAEDPLSKSGPVGDFCRAWTITDLIQGKKDEDGVFHEGPLADKYNIDDWENGAAARMTYLGGHSTNGAVVYDDKFVYSHHGTDPASDMLVNAYDLVRLHLFGSKDKGIDEDAPMKDRPSVKAMSEYLLKDKPYRDAQVASRYAPEDAFDDDDVDPYEEGDEGVDEVEEGDVPSAEDLLGGDPNLFTRDREMAIAARRRQRAGKPKKNWIRALNLNDDGTIKNTLPNASAIITFDPRLWRRIAYNEHREEVCLLDDLETKNPILKPISVKDKAYGDRWQDHMSTVIQALTELPAATGASGGYDIRFSNDTIHKAIQIASKHNAFHPIKDYFDDLRQSDDTDEERLETFFIRYAGVEDQAFTREATRLMAIAAVARVEEPGCKFDYAIILEGDQGIGKSTLIKRLFGAQWFGEIGHDIANQQRMAEAMKGVWAAEFAELASMNKSDVNDLKQFITRTRDDVRMAYGREVADLPRQTVFFGTTNDTKYLRDPTGNRRFWPFKCAKTPIDSLAIMAERDLFWRTAHKLYREMRASKPEGDLPLVLSPEAEKIAKSLQDDRRKEDNWELWYNVVSDWLEEPVTIREILTNELKVPVTFGSDGHYKGISVDTPVQRVAVNMSIIMQNCLNRNGLVPNAGAETEAWNRVKENLIKDGWTHHTRKHGCQKNVAGKKSDFFIHPDATDEDRLAGFFVDRIGPEASSESESSVDRYNTTPDAEDLL